VPDERPDGLGRAGEADGLAEWLALLAPDALAPDALAPDALAPDALAPDGLAPDGLAPEARVAAGLAADGWVVALDCTGVGRPLAAAVGGREDRSAGAVAGLNVATDSIAPATRHTARMLASSGMTVPRPAKGPASRRSRSRRRFARISRR
jgi:hypothetical protein